MTEGEQKVHIKIQFQKTEDLITLLITRYRLTGVIYFFF